MTEIKDKILKGVKSPKLLIIGGLVGILLIFLSSLGGGSSKEEVKQNDNSFNTEQYSAELEKDITQLVEEISGSKKVSVVVTLENTVSYSYADTREEAVTDKSGDKTNETDTELKQNYITVKNADGGEEALLVTANMPDIRGVAIVCEGGDSEIISEKIMNTVTAALNITKKRVYICGRN